MGGAWAMHACPQALITTGHRPCPHSSSPHSLLLSLLQLTQHSKHVDGSGKFLVFQFISFFKL